MQAPAHLPPLLDEYDEPLGYQVHQPRLLHHPHPLVSYNVESTAEITGNRKQCHCHYIMSVHVLSSLSFTSSCSFLLILSC